MRCAHFNKGAICNSEFEQGGKTYNYANIASKSAYNTGKKIGLVSFYQSGSGIEGISFDINLALHAKEFVVSTMAELGMSKEGIASVCDKILVEKTLGTRCYYDIEGYRFACTKGIEKNYEVIYRLYILDGANMTDYIEGNYTEKSEIATTTTSISQKNALASAKNYLSTMAFSYSGLVKQLEYEEYSHDDAVYAVDNCGADWNEQAAKSAENYLSTMSFSRNSLIKQLEYEGFTNEQAVYGAEANGY